MAFRPPPGLVLPPLALLCSLALALVHWQLYDGLLFAQNSWFFHILLGLIPVATTAPVVQPVGAGADLSFPHLEPNPEISGARAGRK